MSTRTLSPAALARRQASRRHASRVLVVVTDGD